MKNLLLMRHAKSSWKDASLSDHQRPLNQRGKRDAPRMENTCRNRVSSGRNSLLNGGTRQSDGGSFLGNIPSRRYLYIDDLYLAGPEMIVAHLTRLPDTVDTAMSLLTIRDWMIF